MSPELVGRSAATARAVVTLAAALLAVLPVAPLRAQEHVDTAAIERIKAEGLGERSQVMETASWLTDVFGARLTGSPHIKAAGGWSVEKKTEGGGLYARLRAGG